MKKPKIVFVFHSENLKSGATRSLMDIVSSLVQSGKYEIDAIFPNSSGTAIDYLNSIGLKEFVIQWAQIGINHKKLYIVAFLNNTRGYWYPYYEFSRIGSDRYLEYENSTYDKKISTQRYMLGTKLSDFYYNLSDNYSIGEYRWISWLTSIAFTFWMSVIVTGYAIYKSRKELLLIYIFIWLLWLTLFAGPLALIRYVYPFTITLPFLFFEKS